jgi:membrane protease YdiL (CAAX protease family)
MNGPNSCLYKELLLFDPSRPAPSFHEIVIFAILVFLLSVVTFRVAVNLMKPDLVKESSQDKKKEMSNLEHKKITPAELAMSEFINAGIYAPIAEELFFRLFIFKTLLVRRLKWNPHVANVFQAVLFGLFHISNMLYSTTEISNVYMQIASATISGLISGWAYMYSNSILPSFLAHAVNNTLAISSEVNTYAHVYFRGSDA